MVLFVLMCIDDVAPYIRCCRYDLDIICKPLYVWRVTRGLLFSRIWNVGRTTPEKLSLKVAPTTLRLVLLIYSFQSRSAFSATLPELVFSERERSLYAIARPSVVCRLSVTLVCPTHAVQIFGNISTAFGTSAIRWHPLKILWRSSQGNPSAGGVKPNRGSQV